MSVNVNGANPYKTTYGVNSQTPASTTKAEESTAAAKANEDTFVKSTEEQAVTYKKPDMNKVNELKASYSNNMGAFQQMVQGLFGKQVDFSKNVFQQLQELTGADGKSTPESFYDDPTWGVEAVATRILDFAKAISGGDESKIATLKDAVEKGFKAAGVAWGAEMPDITGKTYNRVMEMFDEWENAGKSTAVEEKPAE